MLVSGHDAEQRCRRRVVRRHAAPLVMAMGLSEGWCSGLSPLQELIAEAAGKWEPSGLVDDGAGKVQQWTNSGTGGTNYDLLTVTVGTRPTLNATGDRAGTGPACQCVRASATKLATVAFNIAHPNTMVWVVKRTAGGAANMTHADGRTGNTHRMYWNGTNFNISINDNAGTTILGTANSSQDVWYIHGGVWNGNGANASSLWIDTTEKAGTLTGTTASGIVIGDFGTAGGAAFDGYLERGYLWTRALTDAEVNLIVAGV